MQYLVLYAAVLLLVWVLYARHMASPGGLGAHRRGQLVIALGRSNSMSRGAISRLRQALACSLRLRDERVPRRRAHSHVADI